MHRPHQVSSAQLLDAVVSSFCRTCGSTRLLALELRPLLQTVAVRPGAADARVAGFSTSVLVAFVWRRNGSSWEAIENLPDADVSQLLQDGVVLHFDGVSFTEATRLTRDRLLTVHTAPDDRYHPRRSGE